MQHRLFFRIVSLLCLITLLLPLGACTGASGEEDSFFSDITQDDNGRINATLLISDEDLKAHSGQTVLLYELLPGETWEKHSLKDPVVQTRINGKITFLFDRKTEKHDRLYSSFLPIFEDGTPVTDAKRLSNPTHNAPSYPYLWSENPKGLMVEEFSAALPLNLSHAVFEVSLSKLYSQGQTKHPYGNQTYSISDEELEALDRNINAAYDAGMQVSLNLTTYYSEVNLVQCTAMIDFLAERYIKNGKVTSVFINKARGSVEVSAALLTVAQYAFLSRNTNARIYLRTTSWFLESTIQFFADIGELTAENALPWGAGVYYSPDYITPEEELEEEAKDLHSAKITPENLPTLVTALKKQKNPPERYAMAGMDINAFDYERQIADFAHMYATASEYRFDLIIWEGQANADNGLFTKDGKPRPVAEFFADIDAGLSENQLVICKNRSEALYNTLKKLSPTRYQLSGTGSSGQGSGSSALLYDFTDGDLHRFSAPGGGQVQSILSGAYHANVLYASFDKTVKDPRLTTRMENGQALKDSTSLSFHILTQYKPAEGQNAPERCNLTLTLTGTDTSGNVITFRAKAPSPAQSWQNVNFHIAPFVSTFDPTHPVVMSLSASPEGEDSECEALSLWIKSIKNHSPEGGYLLFWILGLIGGGVLIGFLVIFFLYRKRSHSISRKGGI